VTRAHLGDVTATQAKLHRAGASRGQQLVHVDPLLPHLPEREASLRGREG
jgi:hypothetical protein